MKKRSNPCEQVVAIDEEPCHRLVVSNEWVRAFAVEVPAGSRTLCHRHDTEYLVYVAGDAKVTSTTADGQAGTYRYRDENCELLPAGLIHFVENLSDRSFRNYAIELLPSIAKMGRGSGPRRLMRSGSAVQIGSQAQRNGKTRMRTILEEKALAVFVAEMRKGSVIRVSGPALVAAPYAGKVVLRNGKTGTSATLDSFRAMGWIEPLDYGDLFSQATDYKAVIFTLSRQKKLSGLRSRGSQKGSTSQQLKKLSVGREKRGQRGRKEGRAVGLDGPAL